MPRFLNDLLGWHASTHTITTLQMAGQAAVMVLLLHRRRAMAAYRRHVVGQFIKGNDCVLARNGEMHHDNQRRNNLSERAPPEGAHSQVHLDSLHQVAVVRLERAGGISVMLKAAKRP